MSCECRVATCSVFPTRGSKKKWKVENRCKSDMPSDVLLVRVMLVCWNLLHAEEFLKNINEWKIILGSVSRVVNKECSKPVIKQKEKWCMKFFTSLYNCSCITYCRFYFPLHFVFTFYFHFSIGFQWKRFCLDTMVSIIIFLNLITVTIWICNYFGVTLSNFYYFIWKDDRML